MKWIRIATLALFVAAVPSYAQTSFLRILKPAPDQVVREAIPVQIEASAVPAGGYLVIEINDEFMAAVVPDGKSDKLTYWWDSRAEFPGIDAPPEDGQYTIRVKTYNAAFKFQRSNELNVNLRNKITLKPGETVTLAYRMGADTVWEYDYKVKTTIQGIETYSADIPFSVTIADFYGGSALASERFDKTATETYSGATQPFQRPVRSLAFTLSTTGQLSRGVKMQRNNLNCLFSPTTLPANARPIGSTWTGQLSVPGLFQRTPVIVQAKHTLLGLEYFRGFPSAKIKSEYEGSGTIASADPNQPTEPVRINGSRVSYFDYVRGRLIRAEDTYTASSSAPSADGMSGQTTTRKVTVITTLR
jgi:hypothetical protein